MIKQLKIDTLYTGERKQVNLQSKFNRLRISAVVDSGQAGFDFFKYLYIKSSSFTGTFWDLLLLNQAEVLKKMPFVRSSVNSFVWDANYHNLSYDDSNNSFLSLVLDVYFSPVSSMELSAQTPATIDEKSINVEFLYDNDNESICHVWQHVKNITRFADFETSFDDFSTFCIVGRPNTLQFVINRDSKVITENGVFTFNTLCFDSSGQTLYNSTTIPAIWLDTSKRIKILKCDLGSIQPSVNLYRFIN